MSTLLRRHALALLALFVALGGTSYAAIKLPRNSVAAKHIRTGAVRSSDVRDGSLAARDFAAGQLPGGPTGLRGATGPAGPEGATGPAGPAGPTGAPGADGAAGATGAPGVLSVLSFEGSWGGVPLPGNNGATVVATAPCRSAPYTAGHGESAIVSAQGTLTPVNPTTDVLYINIMTSKNGAAAYTVQTVVDQAESISDGTAQTATSKVVPLEAGATYRFGAGFSSNSSVATATGYCSLTAMIVRTS